MVEALLEKGPLKNVLEVGTGCGYQTAVLAQLVEHVYSIERIDELLGKARERLFALKYRNIRLLHGDGNQGWPKFAPFDGIIVSAAPAGVPDTLLQQLSPDGGRMVIPVGRPREQQLLSITRDNDQFHHEQLDMVSFVPMLEGLN